MSKFNKYSGQRGVVPLKGTLQEVRAKVAGRLALFHNNWLKVTHDQWVLETVQGYRLEFLSNDGGTGGKGATDPLKIKEGGSDPLKIQHSHSHFLQFIRSIRSR